MSVQTNTYVIYGLKLPYEEFSGDDKYDKFEQYEDNAFKPEINPVDDITILFDCMNGEYVIFGHVLARTDLDEGFYNKAVEVKLSKNKKKKIRETLSKVLEMEITKEECGFLVITHYR